MNDLITLINALKEKIVRVEQLLNIQKKMARIKEIEAAMHAVDFWSDREKSHMLSQELTKTRAELDTIGRLTKNIHDLEELACMKEMDEAMRKELEVQYYACVKECAAFEILLLLNGEHDSRNAIFSIHAGAGGVDAMDWAGMLLRMYVRFAESQKWQVTLAHETRGEEAGIKSATLLIKGSNAYGYLQSEHGVHRLVRISPFDAEGMRHTSFALVEVMPEFDEVTLTIDPKDLRVDTFLSSGKGGQNVQKNETAVRITHIPTGIAVAAQSERSQLQNKQMAMKLLVGKLMQMKYNERKEEAAKIRGEYQEAAWGNQIRSYVLHPYHQVKDHRTDWESKNPEKVLDGDLMPFIEAYLHLNAL